MKRVAVLSGKGGVGKSSICASIAVCLGGKVICADCDVDAANLSLAIGGRGVEHIELKAALKAEFDIEKCTMCKKCLKCYFDAIEWDNGPRLRRFNCEGCGYCEVVCPSAAVSMKKVKNATIIVSDTRYGFRVVSAQLEIGASGSGKIVYELRRKAEELAGDSEIMLIDSAAGIGCPVIASVTGADFVLLVTEPSISGFSDMKRAMEIARHFQVPCGAVINKSGLNNQIERDIEQYFHGAGIDVLGRLPFDQCFAEALNQMVPVVELKPGYRPVFSEIARQVQENI